MLEDDGRGLLYVPILNYSNGDLEPAREMLLHPRRRPGSVTGAPTAASSATLPSPPSCSPTGPVTVPAATELPLEWMVKKQTHDTARLYGLGDRGTIEAGAVADLNLIDYDHLQMGNPTVVVICPAGGSRLLQGASGYVETIKSGVTTFSNGKETGDPSRNASAGGALTACAQGVSPAPPATSVG